MPKGNNPPRKNTSLTGILYCELKWGNGLPKLQVRYLANPFAKYPIKLPLPTYPIIKKDRIIFEWSNLDNSKGFLYFIRKFMVWFKSLYKYLK